MKKRLEKNRKKRARTKETKVRSTPIIADKQQSSVHRIQKKLYNGGGKEYTKKEDFSHLFPICLHFFGKEQLCDLIETMYICERDGGLTEDDMRRAHDYSIQLYNFFIEQGYNPSMQNLGLFIEDFHHDERIQHALYERKALFSEFLSSIASLVLLEREPSEREAHRKASQFLAEKGLPSDTKSTSVFVQKVCSLT